MTELIVDGYNLLHAAERYRTLLEADAGVARDRLVNDLTSLCANDARVTVVFDGGGNPEADGTPRDEGGVSVIFSPTGVEADTVVEAMAKEAARSEREVLVVTSDNATANVVRGGAVRVMSANAFADEIGTDASERADGARAGRIRSTVEDRLSPDARAILLRMRQGRP
jgi:uncharacterized protein